jgi:hypothetical protein
VATTDTASVIFAEFYSVTQEVKVIPTEFDVQLERLVEERK